MEIRVLRTNENSKLPAKANNSDQCWDLFSCEEMTINPGETAVVDLGVRVELPEGYGFEFRERSGLASEGIAIGAGIIDNGYRGDWKAVVRNLSMFPFDVKVGSKIVQGELVKVIDANIVEVNETGFDLRTDRGTDGWGSTGK